MKQADIIEWLVLVFFLILLIFGVCYGLLKFAALYRYVFGG